LIIGLMAFGTGSEGFDSLIPIKDPLCLEGCANYYKCYAARSATDPSGIVDYCRIDGLGRTTTSDEKTCNQCKYCQYCPSTATSDGICISVFEKCPSGKPDLKWDYVNDKYSWLSIFDFTRLWGKYNQNAKDACDANISIWSSLDDGLNNLKYINAGIPAGGDDNGGSDHDIIPYDPNLPWPYPTPPPTPSGGKDDGGGGDDNCNTNDCCDSDSEEEWPEYVSEQHKIADAQQERMSSMRSAKDAIRNALIDKLGTTTGMQTYYSGNSSREGFSSSTNQGKELQNQRVNMNDYIRKDSIPCWGCSV